MSDASLTNIQMVRPKGPKIFLGILGIAAVGAAAWWFTRPAGPVGQPDEPSRILVVGPDAASTAEALREFGFDTEHGEYDALAAEGAGGAAGTEGIEAILHLADERGFGYVALEDPSTHGMASITVTGDSADVSADHGWAVFSVGDLGMPPTVTVDGAQTVLPRPDYVQVLRAAFKHERLANTLFSESRLPIDAVELHAKIQRAVDLHGAYAMLDRRIDKEVRAREEALVEAEQAEPVPALLAQPMETTESIALGDGTVLSLVQGQRLDSPRDPEVSLQPSPELQLWYHPPGSTALGERQRCTAVRGGLLPVGGAEHVLSPAADALLLEASGGLELWALDVSAQACAFTRKGKVPVAAGYDHTWGMPHASGRVLRPSTPPEGLAVSVWTAGEDLPQIVKMPGCTRLGEPAWIDAEHFAVSCQFQPPQPDPYAALDDVDDPYVDEEEEAQPPEGQTAAVDEPPPPPPEQAWIYVVRRIDGWIVALPGTAMGEHTGVVGLHPIPGASGLHLVATHPWADKLHRVRFEGDMAALFAAAAPTFETLMLRDADAGVGDPTGTTGTPSERPGAVPPGSGAVPPGSGAVPPGAGAVPPGEGDARDGSVLRPAFVPLGAMVAALPGASLQVTTVTLPSSVEQMALSPDGTRMVYTPSDRHTVRVRPLGDGEEVILSNDPKAQHADPRFTADGRAVIFTSHYEGADRSEQVGRRAELPAARTK